MQYRMSRLVTARMARGQKVVTPNTEELGSFMLLTYSTTPILLRLQGTRNLESTHR